jgi:hypothetical protein
VRGQHDTELVLGDGLHEVLQELPPRERVERGDRFVQDQQLRGRRAGRNLPSSLRTPLEPAR